MKTPDMKAPSRTTALRHLHGAGRHLRSNVVAYLALAVAVGSGGSYALAATASNGTFAVCVDKGSGVMHLAKHPRCGRHQTRIGLSSALDRPTVSAWATANVNGGIESASGASVTHAGAGTYEVHVTAASCRHAFENAPVVSVNDGEPPYSLGVDRLSCGVDRDGEHRGRGIHDPHWRGRERGVPATRRAVQLHRLVRVGRGEEQSDARAGR